MPDLCQQEELLGPSRGVVVGGVERRVPNDAEVEVHAVATQPRAGRVDEESVGGRPRGGRRRQAELAGRPNVEVLDELNRDVADGEPRRDLSVRDGEYRGWVVTQSVAPRDVGANDGLHPRRHDDLEDV